MAYEVTTTVPREEDFMPLSDHQEQTPGTFFGGKPVLHLRCTGSRLLIAEPELQGQPDFAALGTPSPSSTGSGADVEIGGIDVWVTSRYLLLWSSVAAKGVQIPYPTITLHAQDRDAVLLQLSLSEPSNTLDDDLESIQLRVVPSAGDTSSGAQETHADGEAHTNGHGQPPEQLLYEAISACQELNPDANMDDDDGLGFDETAPGATGWITSENMADFMDENGNFRMPEGVSMIGGQDIDVNGHEDGTSGALGAGAGSRRTAAEVDAENDTEEEAKWQRTG
jgi:chloride channel, nucleotide-sensitive, 1A